MSMRAMRLGAGGAFMSLLLGASGCTENEKSADLQPSLTRSFSQPQPERTGSLGDPQALARSCANAETPPAKAIETCTMLIETGLLDARAEARTRFNRGAAAMSLNKVEQALVDFDHATVLDPELYEVWPARGWAQLSLGQATLAIDSFEQAGALAEDPTEADLGRGASLVAARRPEEAVPHLTRALDAMPMSVYAWMQYGLAHKGIGDLDMAITAFDQALTLKPNDPAASLQRADLHAMKGNVDAALLDFSTAILLAPDAARPRYARGRYLDVLGRGQEANEDLRKAWRLGWRDEWLNERIVSLGG